jgi:hypothetical protein
MPDLLKPVLIFTKTDTVLHLIPLISLPGFSGSYKSFLRLGILVHCLLVIFSPKIAV